MCSTQFLIDAAKIIVLVAVLFVWAVRYANIVEEFRSYKLPNWLRDLVGILKISFVVMLQSSDTHLFRAGCAGLGILMTAALVVHLKVRNPFHKMLPALAMLSLSIFLLSTSFIKCNVHTLN